MRLRSVFVYCGSTKNSHKCSAVAEMGDRLAPIDIGRKVEVVPFFRGKLGRSSNTILSGPKHISVPVGISIHPEFRHKRHGPKMGGGFHTLGKLGPHVTQCGLGRGLTTFQVAS